MLEKYKDIQPLFFDEINHCFSSGKISHAYLIETNNYTDSLNLTFAFIKEIFKNYVDENEFENISTLIDNNYKIEALISLEHLESIKISKENLEEFIKFMYFKYY